MFVYMYNNYHEPPSTIPRPQLSLRKVEAGAHLLVASQELDEDVVKALSKQVPHDLVFREHCCVCSGLRKNGRAIMNKSSKAAAMKKE